MPSISDASAWGSSAQGSRRPAGRRSGWPATCCCWRRCSRRPCCRRRRRPGCPSSGSRRRAGRCPAGRGAACRRVAHLVPAHARHVRRWHRVVDPQRFVRAQVAVLELHHQPVAQAVQERARRGLGDVEGKAKVGDGQVGGAGEGRVGGRVPVHVELPEVEDVGHVDGGKVVGRAGRRRGAAQVAGQEAASRPCPGQSVTSVSGSPSAWRRGQGPTPWRPTRDRTCWPTCSRRRATRPAWDSRARRTPSAVGTQGVEVPAAAHRIAGLRDGDTLVERAGCWPGKVGDDPAIGHGVVERRSRRPGSGVAGGAGAGRKKSLKVTLTSGVPVALS